MSKVLASIDICSAKHSLSELSLLTGIKAELSSHDKGTPRGRHGLWSDTILRLESRISENDPLESHLKNLFSQVAGFDLTSKLVGNEHIRIYVNIGVTFSTACISVEISKDDLSTIVKNGMNLQISAYPSSEA